MISIARARTLSFRTVVHGLKVVHKSQDVPVTHGHSLQDGNLVPDHVLSPCHKPLVDDLGGIVPPCINVHALLDN